MIKSYFNQIRSNIIKEISKAENEILIAVYWFTNQELFNILIEKLKEGVQIELIIHNDFINNRESGLPFQEFIENGGKFYFSDGNNPMHNKFCVIDKKVLINGSYNWTYSAECKNKENTIKHTNSKELISRFHNEFIFLYYYEIYKSYIVFFP
jgi:phosphatidylserine/phosphatidylglycerophosphate/cardiolipin synthase-like enzyme